MRERSQRGTQMVTLRLGFRRCQQPAADTLPTLVPRLETYLVPRLAGGKSRFPLTALVPGLSDHPARLVDFEEVSEMMQPAITPAPPYYAVIFTSVRTDGDEDYAETAVRYAG